MDDYPKIKNRKGGGRLKGMGFVKITNLLLRKTLGRAITVKKACEEQKIDFNALRQKIVAEVPALKT
jgi:hypothetical protein